MLPTTPLQLRRRTLALRRNFLKTCQATNIVILYAFSNPALCAQAFLVKNALQNRYSFDFIGLLATRCCRSFPLVHDIPSPPAPRGVLLAARESVFSLFQCNIMHSAIPFSPAVALRFLRVSPANGQITRRNGRHPHADVKDFAPQKATQRDHTQSRSHAPGTHSRNRLRRSQ